jgi:cyclomaltodextrin glucanotransferase
MTFYDNHDMARLNASDAGFIDANNLLFTVRGIPVVYYGSEVGFMRGKAEHAGNRNYWGQEAVDAAHVSPIHENLRRVARIRAQSPALQRGLQVNLEFSGDRAAFYRVYQRNDRSQIALVLLNKGDTPQKFRISRFLQPGFWRSEPSGRQQHVAWGGALQTEVAAHGVQVWLLDAGVTDPALRAELDRLQAAVPRTNGG